MPALVLVVEDEPLVAKVTCRYLEAAGLRCVAADRGRDALARVEAGTIPDLAVLDVRLPDMPGPRLAKLIHGRQPQVPILFVSGWVAGITDADLQPLRWAFLPKPFTKVRLVEAVHRLLELTLPSAAVAPLPR